MLNGYKINTLIKDHYVFFVAILLFLLLLPLVSSINYIQNDEHTRYLLVEQFLKGNFKLDPYISTTFYSQGFLGMSFAFLFGLKILPLLTLILSCLSFYFFVKILVVRGSNKAISILLGLMLFFNPFNIYSSLGFMTEIYFLFFLVLSFYSIEKYFSHKTIFSLFLANLVIFVSYLARQVGLIISVALFLNLILRTFPKIKEDLNHLAMQFGYTVFLLIFHVFIFPQTSQMKSAPLSFDFLNDPVYAFSIIAVVLLYLSALFLPVIFLSLLKKKLLMRTSFVLILLITSMLTFWFFKNHFDPLHIVFRYYNRDGGLVYSRSSGAFPYFKNVFGREGFFVEDFEGTKYHYKGFFDLFKYWNLVGIVLIPILLTQIISNPKKFNNLYLIFLVLYGGALLVYPKIYDRYLLYMFPAFLIYFSSFIPAKKSILYISIAPFLAFLVFLNYQYSMDFLLVQNYVWQKSEELVLEDKAYPNEIKSGNSWQALYPREDRNWKYYFSYDKKPKEGYKLAEEKRFNFPFSIFIEPKIYLYMKTGSDI